MESILITYKSKQIGYYPDLILSGRNLNSGMGIWIIEKIILEMVSRSLDFNKAKILFLGVTFKENCPDIKFASFRYDKCHKKIWYLC